MLNFSKLVRLICITFSFLLSVQNSVYAKSHTVLDKVTIGLSSEHWVKTESANLKVTINATLTNSSLMVMRQKIMANLNKIAKGDWHITQFSRSQDSSGLEKLYVNAEARVNQALLTNVNVKAKQVTQPGVRSN